MPAPAPPPTTPAQAADGTSRLLHGLVRMSGRDPHESHRAATPLELLFDLTFVVAFAVAGEQAADQFTEGHQWAAVGGFVFALMAICWAWINFTWFASAYDTDDWFYRLTTLVQMTGVVVLALGLPALFHSLAAGGHLDNRVLVAGYVVMRVAMIGQWLRAAAGDPARRRTCLTYAGGIAVAQVGWLVLVFIDPPLPVSLSVWPLLLVLEMAVPPIAERHEMTPWHSHHIAERYGLLTIIALGEVITGTVTSVSAIVSTQGWSSAAVIVVVAGVGLAFGMWWSYFNLPSAELLHQVPNRAFGWGYGHIAVFGGVAATGAGLHVAAILTQSHGSTEASAEAVGEAGHAAEGAVETPSDVVGTLSAVLAVAVPVAVFLVAMYVLYLHLIRRFQRVYPIVLGVALLDLVVAAVVAASGGSFEVCLVLVTIAPALLVIGTEVFRGRQPDSVRVAG